MYPANAYQTTIAAIGFITITCVLVRSLLHGHLSTSTAYTNGGHQGTYSFGHGWHDAVFNSTLGFQKLFVLNLPERTDHRDALALTGALSGVQFDFMEAVHGKNMSDKALPNGDPQRFDNKGRGSWRAHMNAIRAVVEQNLTSAVIFEDDVDWDIRIKQQLSDFSQASRALLQPLDDKRSIYADPTFPEPQNPNVQTEPMYFDHLPHTRAPEISPYGDDWDVLWLGHCGMRRPVANMLDPWGTIARRIPKGHVVQENDTTAPAPRHIHVFDDPALPDFASTSHHTVESCTTPWMPSAPSSTPSRNKAPARFCTSSPCSSSMISSISCSDSSAMASAGMRSIRV